MRELFFFLSLVVALATSCERYEPSPRASIEGLSSGVLADPRAPIVIDLGMPVDPTTLFVKIALFDTNADGDLGDEDDEPESELHVLVRRDPDEGDFGAKAALDPDGSRLRLTLDSALPVGPKLVLLVEGGLRATSGRVTRYRQRIPFSYVVTCGEGPTKLASGSYFLLLDVERPLGTQIRLFASIDVDPATGALVGQFTNAMRNPGLACPSACPSSDVCRLLPSPECVAPSTRAGTADEHPDFVPNPTPPTGYSFLVQGCAVDDGAATGVLTAPATMIVESPPVTIEGLTMTASFGPDADGAVRATGSLTADVVRLGKSALGPGKGTLTALHIPDERAPADIPRPPPRADAGTDAGL